MSSHSRALAFVIAACTTVLACHRESARISFETEGHNPSVVITRHGATHVVYVHTPSRRLMHHRLGDPTPTAISPAGDVVDARGENAPLFAQRADDSLLVLYPIALAGSHHHVMTELRAQFSRDGGRAWSAPRRVDGDTAVRSHNFADLTVTKNGDAVFSWLDSRSGKQGVQTATLRSDMTVGPATTVDPRTCQCCRTAVFAASTGEVWLAYRDLAEGNIRNVAYGVSSNGQQPFALRGDAANDNWSVDGCPESGPRFTETADGTVWLTWFNGKARAIEVAAALRGREFTKRGSVAGGGVNHPDIGTLPDERLVVFYEFFRDGKRAIAARVSDAAHAQWGAAQVITEDGTIPRYVRRDGQARLSYTTNIDGKAHVRVIDPLPSIAR